MKEINIEIENIVKDINYYYFNKKINNKIILKDKNLNNLFNNLFKLVKNNNIILKNIIERGNYIILYNVFVTKYSFILKEDFNNKRKLLFGE